MNCYYCDTKPNSYEGSPISNSDWMHCEFCDVVLIRGVSNSPHSFGLHIKWEVNLERDRWAINIYPERNMTILSGMNPETGTFYDEIILDHIININKHNKLHKLKTILTFQ